MTKSVTYLLSDLNTDQVIKHQSINVKSVEDLYLKTLQNSRESETSNLGMTVYNAGPF